tara:strand:- start:307 stop:1038 length:732 start_codon:yes stop_codon:yes gene_type:complete
MIYPEIIQHKHTFKELHEYLLNISNKYTSIPKIVFIVTDYCGRLKKYSNIHVLRTSLKKRHIRKNEYILPYIWEYKYFPFIPLKHCLKPIVSFCGLLSNKRKKLVHDINKNNLIESSFIIRDKFWGGSPHDPSLINEFYANILSSHFVICTRGKGNFSMRFYQTLSCGRIPILLDTDMPLPFPHLIKWDNIIICKKTEDEIIETLLLWWKNRNIIEIQKKCHTIYQKFFMYNNFLPNLIKSMN